MEEDPKREEDSLFPSESGESSVVIQSELEMSHSKSEEHHPVHEEHEDIQVQLEIQPYDVKNDMIILEDNSNPSQTNEQNSLFQDQKEDNPIEAPLHHSNESHEVHPEEIQPEEQPQEVLTIILTTWFTYSCRQWKNEMRNTKKYVNIAVNLLV